MSLFIKLHNRFNMVFVSYENVGIDTTERQWSILFNANITLHLLCCELKLNNNWHVANGNMVFFYFRNAFKTLFTIAQFLCLFLFTETT